MFWYDNASVLYADPSRILALHVTRTKRDTRIILLLSRPACYAQEGDSSEWDEVEKELGSTQKQAADSKQSRGLQHQLNQYLSPVFVEALALTFIAEWGDRSQVAFFWHQHLCPSSHHHTQRISIRSELYRKGRWTLFDQNAC